MAGGSRVRLATRRGQDAPSEAYVGVTPAIEGTRSIRFGSDPATLEKGRSRSSEYPNELNGRHTMSDPHQPVLGEVPREEITEVVDRALVTEARPTP
jgi:hypothetical protein